MSNFSSVADIILKKVETMRNVGAMYVHVMLSLCSEVSWRSSFIANLDPPCPSEVRLCGEAPI